MTRDHTSLGATRRKTKDIKLSFTHFIQCIMWVGSSPEQQSPSNDATNCGLAAIYVVKDSLHCYATNYGLASSITAIKVSHQRLGQLLLRNSDDRCHQSSYRLASLPQSLNSVWTN